MKKLSTLTVLLAAALSAPAAHGAATNDFVPTVEAKFYQMVYDNETEEYVTEVLIEVKFDEDVWWRSGFGQQCYVLDSDGNVYEDWQRNFYGVASDYTKFGFGIRGISQYEDADYTLVIPENLLGNTKWNSNSYEVGRSNPELRYEFNVWELAGKPREDKTSYDFNPISDVYSIDEVTLSGGKTSYVFNLHLDFEEPVAIHKDFNTKSSVWDANDNYLQSAILEAKVSESNPNRVTICFKNVSLKIDADYKINISTGTFGTIEWNENEYCEGRSNTSLEYVVNPSKAETNGVSDVSIDNVDGPVFNLQGIEVDADNLPNGMYIRNGKKFIVK